MAEITVSQLAKLVKIDEKVLLQKLEQSGVHRNSVEDLVTVKEKNTLLAYIQSGARNKKQPLTLQRKKTTQLKVAGNRKINIEVRKKKTLVQPEMAAKAIIENRDEKEDKPQSQIDQVKVATKTPSNNAKAETIKQPQKEVKMDDSATQNEALETTPATLVSASDEVKKVDKEDKEKNGFRIISKPKKEPIKDKVANTVDSKNKMSTEKQTQEAPEKKPNKKISTSNTK